MHLLCSGDVADYGADRIAGLRDTFAVGAGVPAEAVRVDVTSASVSIGIFVRVDSRSDAERLASDLAPNFKSGPRLASFFGNSITVESIVSEPMAEVVVELVPAPTPPPQPFSPGSTVSSTASSQTAGEGNSLYSMQSVVIVIGVASATLIVVFALLGYRFRRRRSARTMGADPFPVRSRTMPRNVYATPAFEPAHLAQPSAYANGRPGAADAVQLNVLGHGSGGRRHEFSLRSPELDYRGSFGRSGDVAGKEGDGLAPPSRVLEDLHESNRMARI